MRVELYFEFPDKQVIVHLMQQIDCIVIGCCLLSEGKLTEKAIIDLHWGAYSEVFSILAEEMNLAGIKPIVYIDRHDGILDIAVEFRFKTKNTELLVDLLGQEILPYSNFINNNGLVLLFVGEGEVDDSGISPFFPLFERDKVFEVWIRRSGRTHPSHRVEVSEYKDRLPYRN